MKKLILIVGLFSFLASSYGQRNEMALANGFFIEGDYKNAALNLEYHIMVDSCKDADVFAQAILSYLQNDQVDKTFPIFQKAVERGLSIDDFFDRMRRIAESSGMPSLYEKVELLAIQKHQAYHANATRSLVDYYISNKNNNAAIRLLEGELSEKPDNLPNLKLLAQTYIALNRDSMALATYKKVINIDTTNFDANVFLGAIYYQKAIKKLSEARRKYYSVDEISKMDFARYQILRKGLIEEYIAPSIRYIRNAMTSNASAELKRIESIENILLEEITAKITPVKKSRKMKIN